MSTILGDAYIRIRPDTSGFEKTATSGVSKAMKKATALAGVVAGAAITRAAVGYATEAIAVAEGAATANARLDTVLSNMGHTSGVASKRVQEYARELSVTTGILPNVIKDSQGVLATFENVAKSADVSGGAFDRATAAAADMSATLGMDVSAASMMLGKALNDPIRGVTALRRSGVQLTEAQEEQVAAFMEVGDVASAQGVILAEVEKQVGGTAVATANASDKVKASFATLKERIGLAALPAFEAITEVMIRTADTVAPHFETAIGGVADKISDKANWLVENWDYVESQMESFADRVKEVWPEVSKTIGGVWDQLVVALPVIVDALKNLGPALERMGQLAGLAFEVFQAMPDNVQSTILLIGILSRTGVIGLGLIAAKAVAAGVAWTVMNRKVIANTVAMAANKAALVASKAVYAGAWLTGAAVAYGTSTAALIKNTAAQVANKVALVAGKAAMLAIRGAIIAWTAVQWALNAALSANPIGIVVMAIAGLIAAVVLLYNKNEGFRQLVQKVWGAIQTAIGAVVDWFQQYVPPIWEAVKQTLSTIMGAIGKVVEVVWKGISWYVTTYITIVKNVVTFVFGAVKAYIEFVWNVIKTGIEIVWQAISTVVTTYINAVKTVITTVFDAIRWVIENVMNVIRGVIETVWGVISGVWQNAVDAISNTTRNIMDTISGLFDTGLQKVKDLFSGAVEAIGKIWDGVTNVVKAPIKAMFDWINRNMVGPINSVIDKFAPSLKLPELPTAFADGGYVSGPGGPRDDRIPARLSNGEYVVNAASTSKYRPLLEAINAAKLGFGIGGPSVEAQILGWLKGQGMSNAGIAGILGNLQAESGMNPGAVEGGNGEGHGLLQWSFSRKADLLAFAQQRGTSWQDLGTQLSFLARELTAYPSMWNQLLTASDPRVASQLFSNTFVRPGIYGPRDDYAASFFQAMQSGSLTPDSGESLFDKVLGAGRSLIRSAIEAVANPALGALEDSFGGSWATDFVIGGMRKAVDAVLSWADVEDAASAAAVGMLGYDGPGSGTWKRPVAGVVTSEYGPRGGTLHAGIDIGAPSGQPVFSAAAGKVMQAALGWNGGYGNMVQLDHGAGWGSIYAHLSAVGVKTGQIVRDMHMIGRVGSTGDSTGPHLHFEVLQNGAKINPRSMVQFDSGGMLQPGWSAVYNGTGKPEPVFSDKQWKALSGGHGGPVVNVTNYYPQAEPTSVSTARALRILAATGVM